MRDRIVIGPRRFLTTLAIPLFLGLMLGGCPRPGGPPTSLQILTFNYEVRTIPNVEAVIADVTAGRRRVAEQFTANVCNFSASFAGAGRPSLNVNGVPGQTGFNVNLVGVNPAVLNPTPNPPSCAAVSEFVINIGGRREALSVGGTTSLTNGRVRLAGGAHFDTSQFFQAQLQGFDPNSRRTTGDFRFIGRASPGSNTVLVVEGSYSMNP